MNFVLGLDIFLLFFLISAQYNCVASYLVVQLPPVILTYNSMIKILIINWDYNENDNDFTDQIALQHSCCSAATLQFIMLIISQNKLFSPQTMGGIWKV